MSVTCGGNNITLCCELMCSHLVFCGSLSLSQLVEAFTRSKAKVEAWKGGVYSILSGQISGEFVELVSG